MSKTKVLITGAGGYVGSILVGQLLQEDYEVLALDRYFFGEDVLDAYRDKDNLHIIRKDIREVEVEDFNGVEAVFDLAAISNDPSGAIDPDLTRGINHLGRARVCAMAKKAGVRRYILASSCSVYGANPDICTEDSPINPLTVYAESNYKAEQDAFALADESFCVTALRFSTLFGLSRRMRFDLVINYMSLIAVTKRRVEIMGGGQQWRPLLHVRDAVRALRSVHTASFEAINHKFFNVSITNVKIADLANVVKDKLLFDVEIVILPGEIDKRNYRVDGSRIQKVLNFTPQIDEMNGFDEVTSALLEGRVKLTPKGYTVDWYKHLFEAKNLVDSIMLNGRYLK